MTFLEPPPMPFEPFDEMVTEPTKLLKSGTAQQFEDLATALNMRESTRSRLLLRAAPLDVDFLQAAARFGENQLAPLLHWLQAATNQRPGEDFLRHFSKLPPFVIRCLALPCTTTQRAALRCVLQLARCPALRLPLGEALPRLLELLEVEELRGTAAGALCNVACEATVRPKARVAVPVLLSALPSAGNEAEDLVAALGVLAKDADAASMESMVDPLLACLPREWTKQSQGEIGLTLEVLIDLVRASGPGGSVCFKMAQDARLASALALIFEHFSASQLAATAQSKVSKGPARPAPRETVALSSALKICVLLQDLPAFSVTFRKSRGLEALRSLQENPGYGGYGKKAPKFCQLRCEDPSCADCPPTAPAPRAKAPPTKQEIVQQLLKVLAV